MSKLVTLRGTAQAVDRDALTASQRLAEMPDIAAGAHLSPAATLDWVGMGEIHLPLVVRDRGRDQQVNARIQVYVDLNDPLAKGIHMSRLYLTVDQYSERRALTPDGLRQLLTSLLESHRDLSTRAFIQFDFDFFLRRRALVSENSGWNSYPITLKGVFMDGEVHLELGLGVLYSSTCPCSAALARQLIQAEFDRSFGARTEVTTREVREWLGTEQGILATPHSQRSVAKVLVRLDHNRVGDFPITDLVDLVEEALETPVQTAVKREDEQEFALRNGQNLMFCEDAGRRLKFALSSDSRLMDFWVRVEHHESLHAHNAVSIMTKGVEGGYLPIP
jgi:GTP cyclohydrolase I